MYTHVILSPASCMDVIFLFHQKLWQLTIFSCTLHFFTFMHLFRYFLCCRFTFFSNQGPIGLFIKFEIYFMSGPATVRMVSNAGPPMPMPMQVPPGHMVQQIVDENGILTHVILSPQPPGMSSATMMVFFIFYHGSATNNVISIFKLWIHMNSFPNNQHHHNLIISKVIYSTNLVITWYRLGSHCLYFLCVRPPLL